MDIHILKAIFDGLDDYFSGLANYITDFSEADASLADYYLASTQHLQEIHFSIKEINF